MRTTLRGLCAISISLISILAISCDNAYGIFQNVQQEKKQVGNTVFQETSVYNAFLLGSYYYAATATLNRTAVGADVWSTVSINGSTSYSLRSAVLDSVNNKIYALIETGIERSSTISVWSYDGTIWTGPLSSQSGYNSNLISNFDALFAAHGYVYAELHSYDPNSNDPTNPGPSTYTLCYYNGSIFVPVSSLFSPGPNMTIRGVVWDGLNYWFASEDQLYCASDQTGTSAASPWPFASMSGTIWGISFVSSSSHLYVTTKSGYIYRSTGPLYTDQKYTSPVGLPLSQVIEVPSSSGQILLVGTDSVPPTTTISAAQAQGYFECNVGTFPSGFVGGGSGQVTSNSSLYSTTVSIAPVHSFYFDSVANRLFVCVSPGTSSTSYYGLYESDWNGSLWSGWTAR
jgi:hypothetical protein